MRCFVATRSSRAEEGGIITFGTALTSGKEQVRSETVGVTPMEKRHAGGAKKREKLFVWGT